MKEVITYYKNGVINERYTIDMDGNKQGLYKKYLPTGKIAEECTYKNGKKHGVERIYCFNKYYSEYYGYLKKYNYFKEFYYNLGVQEFLYKIFNLDGSLKDVLFIKSLGIKNRPIFVIDGTIVSAKEYIAMYNANIEEFRNKKVEYFITKKQAEKFLNQNN